MRGHGHGHGGAGGGLEERLLFRGSEAECERQRHKEWSRAWFYRMLLVTCSLIETLVILSLMASNRDIFTEKYFNVRRDLSDVILISLLMGIFGSWLGCMINPKVVAVKEGDGGGGGGRSHGDSHSKLYISLLYWLCVSACILLTAKLIAFDMSFKDNLNMVFLSFFACIVQFYCLNRIAHWREEQANWSLVDKQEEVEEGLENGAAASDEGISAGTHYVKSGEPSLSTLGMLRVLKPYFLPKGCLNKTRCILTWVFLFISKATNLFAPIYIGDAVQKLSASKVNTSEVYKSVLIYSALSLCSKVFKELQNVIYLKVKQTAYAEISVTVFEHLHSLSLEWHLKKKMGNVLRGMDRGVNAANSVVTYLFLYLLPSIAECVLVFVIFYEHFHVPLLSAVSFIAFSVYTILTVQITLWRKSFREKTNKHDNEYHDKATDSVINYETVKYFTNESFEIDRYSQSIRKFQKYSVSTQASLSLLNSTQQIVIQACTATSLCIAAYQVVHDPDHFKVGDFVSINVYILNLFAPLGFLGTVYNVIIQAFVDMTNLSELLAEAPDVVDKRDAQPLSIDPKVGALVEFQDVYFKYPSQNSSSGLQGICFQVDPGTTTAIVGQTGAGKTTISRLLFRFYDPIHGRIMISGQDIAAVQQKTLRAAIGVVPQDTVLFNDSIRYNILYGKLDATEAELVAACKSAQIYDFILTLPDGFDAVVGERGLKLSGGEKQRVAIARCLLKNPPIVLLDEATSALDSMTERSVQESLNNLTSTRTTIVIAHRLSTIMNANQILILNHGKVVESGSHDELLQLQGEYHQLWKTQEEKRE